MLRSPFSTDLVDRVLGELVAGSASATPWAWGGPSRTVQSMPLDVYATDDQAVILAAAPGMRPEDLELTVHQNTVSLSGRVGNIADTEEVKGATWYLRELGSGAYQRSITLPFPLDPEQVQATFENGIVRVVAPKAAQARPHKIAIRTSGQAQSPAIEAGQGAASTQNGTQT